MGSRNAKNTRTIGRSQKERGCVTRIFRRKSKGPGGHMEPDLAISKEVILPEKKEEEKRSVPGQGGRH